ncbi:MAG TPA: Xaa-Pro peptidase family protein [Steroidobacteraceae bacterium]|nr:Xaa-Pro peptidase family protein [Steroidobacteraceae bacterium]
MVLASLDLAALREYRYARVQEQLRANECSAALLYNPINIRYATDSRNMTVWMLHNMGRYCIVPAEGRAVLFEYANRNCLTLAGQLPAIGEVRPALIHAFFDVAEHAGAVSLRWAAEVYAVVRSLMGPGRHRLAVDRTDVNGIEALRGQNFELVEGQRLLELARSIKCAEEIACIRESLAVSDIAIARMRTVLRPGVTENELWAELHHTNIAHGGEWIETRLLSSGPRTNPWFQEASDRPIQAGELVCFDTDMVGPYGYCADVSRTFFCEPGAPSAQQRQLYRLAAEQVAHNCELLRPGRSFREFGERAWPIPEKYFEQNYGCLLHGVGMVDEWPAIGCDPNDPLAQEGEFSEGMTVCVESYIGEVGGPEGVKLEQQVLITEAGHEILSRYPLEAALL